MQQVVHINQKLTIVLRLPNVCYTDSGAYNPKDVAADLMLSFLPLLADTIFCYAL